MQRVAFLLGVKPESATEYKARHDHIWPEMRALLRDVGMRNYTIFRLGSQLFAYCEVDDWHETLRRLEVSDINTRWQEYMSDILETPIDPETGSFCLLEEMFHHE